MPKKATVTELQAEEVAVNSPVRRSTRTLNGNGAPAGIATRRTSQNSESDTPAKLTRTRRNSNQSAVEVVETKPKTRSTRGSTLVEDNSQKESTTPARRGRKPSLNSESANVESEKSKLVRNTGVSQTNSENAEDNYSKGIRRNSANIEVEPEVKGTPARKTGQRRNSATDEVTSSKRSTRGRKGSDTEDVFAQETENPSTGSLRVSTDDHLKPALRRSRRLSSDSTLSNTHDVTPRLTRQSETSDPKQRNPPKSANKRSRRTSTESNNSNTNASPIVTEPDLMETQEATGFDNKAGNKNLTSEKTTGITDLEVIITPLKKRRILEKIEADLDLSVINESSDDIITSPQTSVNDISQNNDGKLSTSDLTFVKENPKTSSVSVSKSPVNDNTIKENNNFLDQQSKRFADKNNSLQESPSFQSSNTHDTNSASHVEIIDISSNDALNVSGGSNASNKENGDPNSLGKLSAKDDSSVQKLNVSPVNVFKSNQRKFSFAEPMEVDEYPSMVSNDESFSLNDSVRTQHSLRNNKTAGETEAVDNISKFDYSKSDFHDNVIIEETEETVDISLNPKSRMYDDLSSSALYSESRGTDKNIVARKSSSLTTRTSLERPSSRITNVHDSGSESEDEIRVEPKSKTSSPPKTADQDKDSSELPSPRRISDVATNVVEKSTSENQTSESVEEVASLSEKDIGSTSLCSETTEKLSPIAKNDATKSTPEDIQHSETETNKSTSHDLMMTDEKITSTTSDNCENISIADQSIVTSEPMQNDPVSIVEASVLHTSKTQHDTQNKTLDILCDSELKTTVNTSNSINSADKQSESTCYDFDLPSDDDDEQTMGSRNNLCQSPENNCSSNENIAPKLNSDKLVPGLVVKDSDQSDTIHLAKQTVVVESTSGAEHVNFKEVENVDSTVGDDSTDEIMEDEETTASNAETETPIIKDNNVLMLSNKDDTTETKYHHGERNNENELSNSKTETDLDKSGKQIVIESVIDKKISEEVNEPRRKLNCDEDKDKMNNTEQNIDEPEKVDSPEEEMVTSCEVNIGSKNKIKSPLTAESDEQKPEDVEDCNKDSLVEKHDSSSTKKDNDDPQVRRSRPSLDDFASTKLKQYIDSKLMEADDSPTSENEDVESDSEANYNEFIDGMAEEGEEDTPSEDSNEIIDEGESIGSSDSEDVALEDDFDENDSFICDDEEIELLSGEEYDLGSEKKVRSDLKVYDKSDIMKLSRKNKAANDDNKKSRIIKFSDSSSDEENEIESKMETSNKSIQHQEESVIVLDDSKLEEVVQCQPSVDFIADEIKRDQSTVIVGKKVDQNETYITPNTSLQRTNRRSSLTIQENIIVSGHQNTISGRINNLVESFCSTLKKGEIALNLSLEVIDSTEVLPPNDNSEASHILSNVKMTSPKAGSDESQPEENKGLIETHKSNETNQIKDLHQKRGVKRRLSRSLDEVYEEEEKRKKQKRNKKFKKSSSNESLHIDRDKMKKVSDIESFGLVNGLITDVKNRPRRVLKPSTAIAMDSWKSTKIQDIKPSTSTVSEREKIKIGKYHPKDFKNQLLFDSKRVKRIETKTLLKKKGVNL